MGVGRQLALGECHPERSEGAEAAFWLLRFAQDDTGRSKFSLLTLDDGIRTVASPRSREASR